MSQVEHSMESQDTEITLGAGKMLGLFFGLVALCAVFFGLGFSLGRKSAQPSLLSAEPSAAGMPAARPGAVKSTGPSTPSTQPGEPLSFYKAVEQKQANPQLAAAPKDNSSDDSDKSGAPDAAIALAQGYFVQVAAVSKHEDAQALIDALKKKQYAAFSNNSGGDKLFHVQIGPFNDVKDAELLRAKLVSDGYNPILKK
jgi:DedD protein